MTDPRQTATEGSPFSLSLPPVDEIAAEVRADAVEPPEDPELAALADAFVREVLTGEAAADRQREAVDGMGIEIQRQAAHRSSMLQAPMTFPVKMLVLMAVLA